MSVFGTEGEG